VGCNESTVASRLYAAREKVRSALIRSGLLESNQAIAEVV
jgi:DNA-directed RNA polymerase specialized sigma24 family protein